MGFDARNSDFAACEQQRRRPVCAFVQSDQYLCYSLSEKQSNLILHLFLVSFNMTKSLATPLSVYVSTDQRSSQANFLSIKSDFFHSNQFHPTTYALV